MGAPLPRSILSFGLLLVTGSGVAGFDCEPWMQIGSLPTQARYTALVFGGDSWVAVGRSGTIAVSADGATWSIPDSPPTAADLRAVAWGNGEFVAVGSGVILSGSADGSLWSVASTNAAYELHGVAWSGAVWIAVGDDALVLSSVDGRTWETVDTPATAGLRDVIHSFVGFVAVGLEGQVLTSRDGRWWTLQAPVPAGQPESLVAVAAGPDRLVAVGGDFASLIVSSADGAGWNIELLGAGGRDWLRDVAWGEPGFVVAGALFADLLWPWTVFSSDGQDWDGVSTPGEGDALTVAWGQRRWLLVIDGNQVLASGVCFSRWIQVVASLPGAFGSRWRTDLTVRNPGDASVQVELVFDPAQAALSLTEEIGPGAQAVWEDVVGAGLGIEGKGPLVVRSDGRVVIAARLANVADDGTFGQWMPGMDRDNGVSRGHPVQLIHLRQLENTYRTNLTFANLSDHNATVAVELFATDGNRLDRHEETLVPGEMLQELEPFVTLGGAPNLGWGFAEVSAVSGEGIVVTASVIDSRTNDATTVLPEPK